MSLSNSLGLLGRKVGMMRLFTDDGDAVPVTVVDVSNNRVTQVKTEANDGYVALQVTFGARKASRVTKPAAGHLAKAGVEAGEIIQEFRVTPAAAAKYAAGATVPVTDVFSVGQKVDVQGTSIGKGFTGTIKRHNMSSQRASHGNSRSHNVPGSIGMAQDPGRVFPGKRMSGHLGDVTVTTQNLEVVQTDKDRGLILVRGAVPGLIADLDRHRARIEQSLDAIMGPERHGIPFVPGVRAQYHRRHGAEDGSRISAVDWIPRPSRYAR